MRLLDEFGAGNQRTPLGSKEAQNFCYESTAKKEGDPCPFDHTPAGCPFRSRQWLFFTARSAATRGRLGSTTAADPWTPISRTDKFRAVSTRGEVRIMDLEDVPKHAGDLCPIDRRPVRRRQMSVYGEHYALYCDVCQTFWPENHEHHEPAVMVHPPQPMARK
jgi:hypothetical protein